MQHKTKQLPRLVLASLLATFFVPGTLMASEVSRTTFNVANFKEAMTQITQGALATESKQVNIRTESITVDAGQTRVTVATSLPGVEQIAIFAENNPRPLLANYKVPKDSVSSVLSVVKIQKDTNIVAVVKADGKFYTTKYLVKVGVPGCGG